MMKGESMGVFDDWDEVADPINIAASSSWATQIGAIVGFFVGAGIGALCCWAAWRSGERMLWLCAVACLPLGLVLGGAIGAAIRSYRRSRRRKPRKQRSHKRRKADEDEDE
jgi:MFS family permease